MATTATTCVTSWPALPSMAPAVPPMAATAKMPVAMAPQMPPTPWISEDFQRVVDLRLGPQVDGYVT